MLFDKYKSKKYLVILGATIFLLVVFTVWLAVYMSRPMSNKLSLSLPTVNFQKTLIDGGSKLYASNQNLSDLLEDLDIFFKQQGLNSDGSSQDFKYDNNQSKPQKIDACVEFKYFKSSDEVLKFTLIPNDPACFTKDPAVVNDIKKLYQTYTYVYAAELTLLK